MSTSFVFDFHGYTSVQGTFFWGSFNFYFYRNGFYTLLNVQSFWGRVRGSHYGNSLQACCEQSIVFSGRGFKHVLTGAFGGSSLKVIYHTSNGRVALQSGALSYGTRVPRDCGTQRTYGAWVCSNFDK